MSRTLWIVAVMGFVAVVIVVVAMLISLTMFQQSPASNRAKLGQQVGNEFGFPAASADVRDIMGRIVLLVVYETAADSKFDEKVQKAEMEKVASFVEATYDGADRRSIQEIRIRRREIRTRGCWGRTIENHHTLSSPRFKSDLERKNPSAPALPEGASPVRR